MDILPQRIDRCLLSKSGNRPGNPNWHTSYWLWAKHLLHERGATSFPVLTEFLELDYHFYCFLLWDFLIAIHIFTHIKWIGVIVYCRLENKLHYGMWPETLNISILQAYTVASEVVLETCVFAWEDQLAKVVGKKTRCSANNHYPTILHFTGAFCVLNPQSYSSYPYFQFTL